MNKKLMSSALVAAALAQPSVVPQAQQGKATKQSAQRRDAQQEATDKLTLMVREKGKHIIIDELGVEEKQVTLDARFIDDLGADSLDTVELVMRAEEEFGIEIPDEDAEKLLSVGDAYKYIVKRLRQKQATR